MEATRQRIHRLARKAVAAGRRDPAVQYTSDTYQQTLSTLGMTYSMSRTGCCYDNAARERFFWSLKQEWNVARPESVSAGLSQACPPQY